MATINTYFSLDFIFSWILFSLHCNVNFYFEYKTALIPTFNAIFYMNTQKLGLNGGFKDFCLQIQIRLRFGMVNSFNKHLWLKITPRPTQNT